MAIILNIDTSVHFASVCLAQNETCIQYACNDHQQDHASWLHVAIRNMIANAKLTLQEIEAIAVTIGPGSYTGLRVGLSTAKGLCYALNIPLLAIPTLEVMACAVIDEPADFYCPLIDARRMEVFTAVYNKKLEVIIEPCAMILMPGSFNSLLQSGKMIFSGTGADKFNKMINHPGASFSNKIASAKDMMRLAANSFVEKKFADIAYSEPFYIKEFHSPAH